MKYSIIVFFIFILLSHSKCSVKHQINNNEKDSIKTIGILENGKKTGLWLILNKSNDTLSAIYYTDGIPNGPFHYYFEDTIEREKFETSQLHNYSDSKPERFLAKGGYKNGKLHGLCCSFYANGKLAEIGTYELGLKIWCF